MSGCGHFVEVDRTPRQVSNDQTVLFMTVQYRCSIDQGCFDLHFCIAVHAHVGCDHWVDDCSLEGQVQESSRRVDSDADWKAKTVVRTSPNESTYSSPKK